MMFVAQMGIPCERMLSENFSSVDRWLTHLPGINQNPRFPSPNQICIGSLKLHLPRIPTHDPDNYIRDIFHISERRKTRLLRRQVVLPDPLVEGDRVESHVCVPGSLESKVYVGDYAVAGVYKTHFGR